MINGLLDEHSSKGYLATSGSINSVTSTSSHPLRPLTPHVEGLQYQTIADAAIEDANRSLLSESGACNSSDSQQYSTISGRLNKNCNRALPATPALLAAAAEAVSAPVLPATANVEKPVNRNLALGVTTDTDYTPWSEHGSDTYYGVPVMGAGRKPASGADVVTPSLTSFTPLPSSVPRIHPGHHRANNQSMNHSTGSDDTYFDDASFDTLDPYSDEELDDEDDEDEVEDEEYVDESLETKKSFSPSKLLAKSPPPPPPSSSSTSIPISSPALKPKPPPRKPGTTTTTAAPTAAPTTAPTTAPTSAPTTSSNPDAGDQGSSRLRMKSPDAEVDASFDARDISVRAGDPSKGEAATVITVHRTINAGSRDASRDAADQPTAPNDSAGRKRRSSGDGLPVKTFGDKLAAFQRGAAAYRSHRQPPLGQKLKQQTVPTMQTIAQQKPTEVQSKPQPVMSVQPKTQQKSGLPQQKIAKPVQSLQPTPKPTPKPIPQPILQPIPKPIPKPTPQPTPQPILQPTRQPTPQPTPKPTPQPTPQPILQPMQPLVKPQQQKIVNAPISRPIAILPQSIKSKQPVQTSNNTTPPIPSRSLDFKSSVPAKTEVNDDTKTALQMDVRKLVAQVAERAITSSPTISTPSSTPVAARRQATPATTFLPANVKASPSSSSPTPRPRERTFEHLKDMSSNEVDEEEEEDEEEIQNTGHHIMKQFENSFNKDDFVIKIHKVFNVNSSLNNLIKRIN